MPLPGPSITPAPDWTSEDAWVGTRRPILEAHALPAEAYVDDAFFALEQDRVFGTSWVCVGIADELDPVGKVLVRDLGGRSVLITRNGNGELRGFANTCRHRGTQLVEADCTLGRTIRCPYHRWGYDRDGVLVATPQFADAGIDRFDPADYGLHTVRVEQWGCLLFATLDESAPSVAEWFGDLAPWIELNTALVPLFTGDFDPTGEEWARIATAGTIWLVLPLGFGIYRLLRSEVK
jgi:phenylpropionate dioxygenase-like ring-hydroxylating dioxygenase large terminal subunit